MIKIEYEDEYLLLKASGHNFSEQIESLKSLGAQYDSRKKYWSISVGKFNEVFRDLEHYTISISEYDKQEIKKYFEEIDELEVIFKRSEYKKFNAELLNIGPLKSFQEEDFNKAINRNRFLASWSTGLGKSWLLSGLLTHLRHQQKVNKALILTSSIGILNLPHELKKFIPNYNKSRTLIVKSITQLKNRLIFDEDYDIIVCGYDTFRAICDAYDKSVNDRKKKVKYRTTSLPLKEWFGNYNGIIFLDECHLLGSPSSLRSRAIEMNLRFFKYRYMFSATPADKEEKMYLTLKILNKKLVNGLNYYGWVEQFCTLGNKWSKYGLNKDTWNHQKWALLQDDLYKNYAAKREKALLGLKPAYDIPTIYVDMSPEHREIYEAFTYEVMGDIKQRNVKNNAGLVANLTNTFTYLQLAVDNPLCLLKTPSFEKFGIELQHKIKNFNYNKSFNKLNILDSIIEEECIENDNKIIISYYHPITLEGLKNHLKTGFHVVSSDIPKEQRFEIIEDFKKSSNKIILASIMIANNSYTLTECKAAVFFEKTWEYIIYEQFRGRIYRIGQEDEVRYYNLCFNKSIDNLMLLNLEQKGKVVDGLIKKNILTPDEWRLTLGGDYEEQNNFLRLI